MDFVGREMELNVLDDLYLRKGAQFLILYGRRRIGKTRLVTHWLKQLEASMAPSGTPGRTLYWMASQTSATNQLRAFSQTLLQFFNPILQSDRRHHRQPLITDFTKALTQLDDGLVELVRQDAQMVLLSVLACDPI